MRYLFNIFDYSDYRDFIKKWLEHMKAEKKSNLTQLAAAAQVHTTFLSQVLSGAKDLSLEQAAYISQYLEHTKIEKEYFFTLIQLDRAGTTILKGYWRERLNEVLAEKNKLSHRFEKHRQLNFEQKAIFYSSWIYAAAWSWTGLGIGQTVSEVAERFQITRDRAEDVLLFLAQTGLCVESGGVFRPGEMHVHIPSDSPLVAKHHSNWRLKALQRMDRPQADELNFTAPMSISLEDFGKIREKLNLTIKETVEVAKSSEAEDLVCLNIDFFRVD